MAQLPLVLLVLAACTGAMAYVLGRLPRQRGLRPDDTTPRGVALFAIGLIALLLVSTMAGALLLPTPERAAPPSAEAPQATATHDEALSPAGRAVTTDDEALSPAGPPEADDEAADADVAGVRAADAQLDAQRTAAAESGVESAAAPALLVIVSVQALGTIAGALAVVLGAWWLEGGPRRIGLRRHTGSSAVLWALGIWVAFVPVLLLAALLNRVGLDLLGIDAAVQQQLAAFAGDPSSHGSAPVWLAMALVIPIGEEVVFRGALYGGLRRLCGVGWATVLSGLLFAALHEPTVLVPVAALGMLLAWTYERTGSLLVPCLVHALHNSFTLLAVSLGWTA